MSEENLPENNEEDAVVENTSEDSVEIVDAESANDAQEESVESTDEVEGASEESSEEITAVESNFESETEEGVEEEVTSIDSEQLQRIIEGAILAAGEPLSISRLQALFNEKSIPEKSDMLAALTAIQESCEGRGYDLIEVATGWRFQVRANVAQWVNRLWDEKPQKYSRALLETLALIAYRQPLTRGDIEEVRGVAVSSHIIKTLSERDWVKVVGHRDVPGRPALYATTRDFLDYFNLKSLDELPTLGELKDIESINQNLGFDESSAQQGEKNEEGEATPDGDEGLSVDIEPSQAEEAEAEADPETQAALGSDEIVEEQASDVDDIKDITETSENTEEDLEADEDTVD